jgi:hypothetical protein
VAKASKSSAIRQSQPPLATLQGLDVMFFIHAEHDSVVRRIKIESDNICRLGCKLRVCTKTPGSSALHMDAMFAEHSPECCLETPPNASDQSFPVHVAFPEGGSLSSMAKICFSIPSSYRRPAHGRGASRRPSNLSLAMRVRHLLTVAGRNRVVWRSLW